MTDFLTGLPLWMILGSLLLILPMSLWWGTWLARRCEHPGGSYKITESVPTSILGVHALLVGFTFSMAVTRYEVRREIVVREANAIGTAYLRAKILPSPFAEQAQGALRDYAALQLQYGKLTPYDPQGDDVDTQIARAQKNLWSIAQAMTLKFRSPIEALFVSALNEVIDVHSEREHANRNQLPGLVLILLVITLVAALMSLGFLEAVKERKSGVWLMILSVLFAVVITLIIDLDRPRRGLIRVTERPMEELSWQLLDDKR